MFFTTSRVVENKWALVYKTVGLSLSVKSKWFIFLFIIKFIIRAFWQRLTDLFPMQIFSTPWKHQKTLRLSDEFRGKRKGALGTNRLMESSISAFHATVLSILGIQKETSGMTWVYKKFENLTCFSLKIQLIEEHGFLYELYLKECEIFFFHIRIAQ